MAYRMLLRWFAVMGLLVAVAHCAPLQRQGDVAIPDDARLTHRAVFIGESNHDTVGTVSVYRSGKPAYLVFEPNFRMTRAPGTVIAFGLDGYQPETVIGELVRMRGRQSYALPTDLRVRDFNEVWLWDAKADKPLGLARLVLR